MGTLRETEREREMGTETEKIERTRKPEEKVNMHLLTVFECKFSWCWTGLFGVRKRQNDDRGGHRMRVLPSGFCDETWGDTVRAVHVAQSRKNGENWGHGVWRCDMSA